ncbi:sulfite exporter TauE/SafE family protein [Croceicoccus sp. F390]|uniref:Probable membrane transporter protein n=1 Tax=Croceicoccus esteveae TaxID=3075597 RepID=A0ABU2ZIH0_9SPHN|nr:sulfite exporter TauE/SafE family protein [Croceicoccus sp. F390]MDT0576403.1 sulfite exporter TauE/SafE family protein [Croceicoccus sp. F390]
MDVVLIALVAALASALTLYSGFGLGTILLPAFALFLPAPLAVAATGVVHLLNNLFKGSLLRKRADWATVLKFGIPAVPAAIAGAWLLAVLGDTPRLFEWNSFSKTFGPTGAGLTIGLLMITFAALELQRWFQELKAPPRLMPVGGLLTGFFGGLTGQQGAFRSIFLLRSELPAERFIATGVMIAILVDLSRLATYAGSFTGAGLDPAGREGLLVLVGTFSAFAGAYFATRHLDKMTIGKVRYSVATLMLLIGCALTVGLLG